MVALYISQAKQSLAGKVSEHCFEPISTETARKYPNFGVLSWIYSHQAVTIILFNNELYCLQNKV